jgi:hypothetical protein
LKQDKGRLVTRLGVRRPMAAMMALAMGTMGLVVAQGVSGAEPAQAACINGIGRWAGSTITPYVSSRVPSTWNSSVAASINRWNGITGSTLRYNAPVFNSYMDGFGFEIDRYSFRALGLGDYAGMANGAQNASHSHVRVYLNADWKWNTAGTMSQAGRNVDVQTIVVHEVGHASGLAHPYPEVCGAGHPTATEKLGVMYFNYTAKRIPNADEKTRISWRY